jgi:heme-degrading monooxygenase HmoA
MEGKNMIARIWKGTTPTAKADAYVDYVKRTGIEGYKSVEGNRGQYILRKTDGDVAEVTVVSFWDSMDAIRAFAGPEPEKPVYYPEDEEFLLEFADRVEHYDVAYAPSTR